MSKVREKLLTDTFDVKGIWFLPESDMSKEGIKGTLRYSPSRITLELIGTFNQVSPFTNAETPHELTIYGFSEVGEWFTLLDCLPTQARMSAPGFETVTYIVNQFYLHHPGNFHLHRLSYLLQENHPQAEKWGTTRN